MIKVLGLTGGIGTGKSTAAVFFKNKRFAHIDADQIGRDLTADGSSILSSLDELFGPDGEFGDGGRWRQWCSLRKEGANVWMR